MVDQLITVAPWIIWTIGAGMAVFFRFQIGMYESEACIMQKYLDDWDNCADNMDQYELVVESYRLWRGRK